MTGAMAGAAGVVATMATEVTVETGVTAKTNSPTT